MPTMPSEQSQPSGQAEKSGPPTLDEAAVLLAEHYRRLVEPGQVVELRALDVGARNGRQCPSHLLLPLTGSCCAARVVSRELVLKAP